jgi:hypothetical protein
LLRISENNEDGTPVDTSDAEFSIISSGSASLILVSPNGGEQLPVGSIHAITWTVNNDESLAYRQMKIIKSFCGGPGAPWHGGPIRNGLVTEDVFDNSICTFNLHLAPLTEKSPLVAEGK